MTPPPDHRPAVGRTLIGLAIAAAVVAAMLWQRETNSAEHRERVEELVAIMDDRPVENVKPNRSLPTALGGLAAVLFLGGAIVIAAAPMPQDGP